MNAGDIAEAAFAHHAVVQGYEVFLPTSHNTKTDLIIRRPKGRPIMVQVKKGTKQPLEKPHHKQRWKFLIGSGRPSTRKLVKPKDNPRYTLYTESDFDILAVYIMELDEPIFALYPLPDIIGTASLSWNLVESPRNNWEILDDLS